MVEKPALFSRMPAIIAIMLSAIMVAVFWMLTQVTIPEENQEVVFYLCGSLNTGWMASIMYWVGTTRGSAEKQRQIESAKAPPK